MPFTFSPLPHTEARDRIAGLPLVTREVMDGLLPELKAYAFCITGIDRFDQLARIREEISQVPAGERTWQQAKRDLTAELEDRLGGKEAAKRAELLLRTHTFRGYAASRYRSLMAQRDVFPFWQYKTHGDGRVRPSHAALNGKILPAGHPVWQKIFPPWDWGCRCLVVPMMGREVEGLKALDQDKAIESQRVWDGDVADAIEAGQRLPNGISLLPSQTWGSSPWSEPGTVRHTWSLVQQRYAQDPETLAAFAQWARATRIDDLDMTVDDWLNGGRTLPRVPPPPRTAARLADQLVGLAQERQQIAVDMAATSAALHSAFTGSFGKIPNFLELRQAKAEVEDRWQQHLNAARAKIEIPRHQRGQVDFLPLTVDKKLVKRVREGAAVVESLVHRDLLPLKVGVEDISGQGKNAFCGYDSVIHVSLTDAVSTMAHEITHAIEMQHPSVLQASLDFLAKRAGGQAARPLFDITGDAVFDEPNMTAFEDDWVAGGGSAYTGRADYQGKATEILTMGIERLYNDPVGFAVQDRDHFEFMLKTLQQL